MENKDGGRCILGKEMRARGTGIVSSNLLQAVDAPDGVESRCVA